MVGILKKITLLLLISLCSNALYSTHLIGGNIGYEYIGLQPSGKYRYKVKLVTYVDCAPSSEIPYAENPIKVGVYEHNILMPMADKVLVDSVLLFKTDTTVYIPYLPPGCVIGAATCIIEAKYEGFIDVNPSVNGYYFFYERCCRNSTIINLNMPTNTSSSFLAYAPPTSVVNSTIDFLVPPIPFMCVNDTVTIFNTALDPDGDSLVYSFSTPYDGYYISGSTLPALPSPTLNWPVPFVNYIAGFTPSTPFSFTGNATIHSTNGIATYYATLMGSYVVCVQVDEYRNGNLLTSTKRDLQLLVNNCPNNYPPNIVENNVREYTVHQGDSICFDVRWRDPEDDSSFVEASGEVFDTSITNPTANFTITEQDSNSVKANFCWVVPCDLDTGEYEFMIRSYDNGCPPKEEFYFYKIRVLPVLVPEINAPDSVCKTTENVLIYAEVDLQYLYNWNVVGGSIIENDGDSIYVDFGSDDTAYVNVEIYNTLGCYIGADSTLIHLISIPPLTAMPDDSVCMYDTMYVFASGTHAYFWYSEQQDLNDVEGNFYTIIDSTGWFYVAGLPNQLCPPSDSVYFVVLDLPNVTSSINDSSVCIGDTVLLEGFGAMNYHWESSSHVMFADSSMTEGYVFSTNQNFILTGTDIYGCNNYDTISPMIFPLPTLSVLGNTSYCFGDTTTVILYGGDNFTWTPNTYLSSNTNDTVSIFSPTSTSYSIHIVDSNLCQTDTVLPITVFPIPTADFTFDTLDINCDGTKMKFNYTGSGGNTYQWSFGNTGSSNEMNPEFVFDFGNSYPIQLVVSSIFGCSSVSNDTIQTDSLENLIEIVLVNIFTPNNDTKNELLDFHLNLLFEECTNIEIFNRWGTPVFSVKNKIEYWNGKTNDNDVPEGVYFWVVDIRGISYKGFVHLFR